MGILCTAIGGGGKRGLCLGAGLGRLVCVVLRRLRSVGVRGLVEWSRRVQTGEGVVGGHGWDEGGWGGG